jgi:geranylgeranyl diphosphate synthase, type II
MPLNLDSYLKDRKALVDSALDNYLPKATEPPTVVHEAMRYSALDGGKRIRPILTLAACEAVGGNTEAVLPAACAIECIHTFSLIHDDLPCMDDDDYRRGRPTSHRVYGEAMALLAGDALFAFAFQLISKLHEVPSEAALEVMRLIAEATGTGGMVGGQVLDMLAQGEEMNISAVEQIHRLKTGALLEASVLTGGILGGGSKKQISALSDYGKNIGLAFQIADDVLDLKGDSEKLGKSTGSDLRMQKATYPSLIGMEKSEEAMNKAMNDAIEALSTFDEKADPLRLIAKFVVEREM